MAATALPVVAALAAFLAPLSQATQDVQDTPPAAGVPLPAASVPEPAMDAPVYGPPAETAATIAVGERPAAISPALFTAVERAMADYTAIASSRVSVRASRADLRAGQNRGLTSLARQGVALGDGKGDRGATEGAE